MVAMEMMEKADQVLEDALNLWWLRPENALALASYVVHGVDLKPTQGQKAADFACGDGVNTFFKCGGRFAPEFDLFLAGIGSQSTKDVAAKNVDLFDHYDEQYFPKVNVKPEVYYAVGTDHKQNLLKKAQHLDFYEALHLADLRDNVQAIASHSLDKIYCNSLYWVAETDVALKQMQDKLKPDGEMIIDVFTTEKKQLDFGKMFPSTSSEWQEMLNRGRQATNPGLRSEEGWRELFEAAGLEVVEQRNIFPASIAHIWNLGLRPIFPMLNKMAASISPQNRQEIKAEWVGVFKELLFPVLMAPEAFSQDQAKYRLQFVLKAAR
ncbi:hypothetical protein [Thiomicrorhabdus xiamenensis]|uniref:Methyltransferase domain-containing protein n=1 Tax=Thiomicrorhabdus xiamenensis TaxID=2739063 RepID=A0A7D4TEN9_9GAMM|nr:hypothetical protein [Thiomicrorhabdus xiamenensis]QKI89567.1 hypothetical protein HQN79_08305 [Thiomicrorhabdus xiamenensis]